MSAPASQWRRCAILWKYQGDDGILFHSLKNDIVHGERFRTRLEARQAIFEYIDIL